jgi:hypothetical protein
MNTESNPYQPLKAGPTTRSTRSIVKHAFGVVAVFFAAGCLVGYILTRQSDTDAASIDKPIEFRPIATDERGARGDTPAMRRGPPFPNKEDRFELYPLKSDINADSN